MLRGLVEYMSQVCLLGLSTGKELKASVAEKWLYSISCCYCFPCHHCSMQTTVQQDIIVQLALIVAATVVCVFLEYADLLQ